MFQWVCYEVVERQIRLREIVKCLPKLVLGSNVQPIFEQGTSITFTSERNFICCDKCCCRKDRSSTEILIICFPAVSQLKKERERKGHFLDRFTLMAHLYGTWPRLGGF